MNPEPPAKPERPEQVSSFQDEHLTKQRISKRRVERRRFDSPMLTRRPHVTIRVTTPTTQGAKFWRPKGNSWSLPELMPDQALQGTWPPPSPQPCTNPTWHHIGLGTNPTWNQAPFTLDRGRTQEFQSSLHD